MNPRIPAVLHPVLHDYELRVDQECPGLITAMYLVGSIALDGFNPGWSDIDFLSLLSRRIAPGDMESILKIHQAIETQSPKWKMEGIYLQPGDLGLSESEVEPYPSYHDGKLELSRGFEVNPVTWWILKNRGIPMCGPKPTELPFEVNWQALLAWMRGNLNTYWASWTNRPDAFLALLTDYGVQWAVLGVLRQFYTFRENRIVSKTEAGKYALVVLPERWHWIIQAAIALRGEAPMPARRPRPVRAVKAVQFLKYILNLCNDSFREEASSSGGGYHDHRSDQ